MAEEQQAPKPERRVVYRPEEWRGYRPTDENNEPEKPPEAASGVSSKGDKGSDGEGQ